MPFDTRHLAAFQQAFLDRINIAAPLPASTALRVYRDTGFYGLLDALNGVYEVTAKALGADSFNAFARDFIRAHPLSRGDRNGYGADFSDFLTTHLHAGGLPWLPDLVAFEWALHYAHHADDAPGADFSALLDPTASVTLHPSVQRLDLSYDIPRLYTAIGAGDDISDIAAGAYDLLVGRDPSDVVHWIGLAPYEAECLDRLSRSGSLAATLEQMAPDDNDMMVLQTLLARLVQHGLLITS